MAECRAALLQLQEVERTTASTQPTPERAIELHHPAAAIEFEFQANGIAGAEGITQIKGFVEAAQAERDRRARQCGNGGNAAVRSWCDRASQLAAMAQQFELAATESVGTLEEILSFQSWDHRLVDRQYGIYLRELETASTTEDLRWRQMKEVKVKHERLERFVLRIRAKERRRQFTTSKDIRAKQHNDQALERTEGNQMSERTEASDINA
jgi:hypothetical protein